MMPIEAIDQVIRDTRQLIDGGGSHGDDGIARIAGELGLDIDDLEAGAAALELFARATKMPFGSALYGAFVSGAYWRRAEETVITDEMVDRAATAITKATSLPGLGDLPPDFAPFLADANRDLARQILEAALNPVADPPTDDGAGGSS